MEVKPSTPAPRVVAIADAAIEVLAAEGGRGLTHRAIDRHLELPLGSTANYFSTRTALLRAVNLRLLEIEIALWESIPHQRLSRARAATLLAERIAASVVNGARHRYIAHHEVLLQSARDQQLRLEIDHARQRFVDIVARVLTDVGCKKAKSHAHDLLAMMEGLLLNQLLYNDGPVDLRKLTSQVRRCLAQC
ncbi:hypothetical protein [Mycobacterium sp. 236(2023)]|uniref:TetR/AcrR family transcriptional regulator n=1 Tax=Mycobacterium sp. 236(2023) TaxID=3038163 RepID=UPI00241512D9|nr:hypothetical protein [Mycobacterium sp. 236(2023)]MDG4668106.1 hypothetical protein [Mycobacterium sp. 236(2023)]